MTLALTKLVDPLQMVFAVQVGRKPHWTRGYWAAPIALILSMRSLQVTGHIDPDEAIAGRACSIIHTLPFPEYGCDL